MKLPAWDRGSLAACSVRTQDVSADWEPMVRMRRDGSVDFVGYVKCFTAKKVNWAILDPHLTDMRDKLVRRARNL